MLESELDLFVVLSVMMVIFFVMVDLSPDLNVLSPDLSVLSPALIIILSECPGGWFEESRD